MPTFNIQLFEGRTVDQKRAFVEAITRVTCETLGCEPPVDIILTDVKKENWATAGSCGATSAEQPPHLTACYRITIARSLRFCAAGPSSRSCRPSKHLVIPIYSR